MSKEKQSFPQQAAKYSFWVPGAVFFVNMFLGNADLGFGRIIIATVTLVLILSAFILSIYSLYSVKQYGSKGILVYAIGGLLINGLSLLLLFFGVFFSKVQ